MFSSTSSFDFIISLSPILFNVFFASSLNHLDVAVVALQLFTGMKFMFMHSYLSSHILLIFGG